MQEAEHVANGDLKKEKFWPHNTCWSKCNLQLRKKCQLAIRREKNRYIFPLSGDVMWSAVLQNVEEAYFFSGGGGFVGKYLESWSKIEDVFQLGHK